jgi:hypothetical protein
MTLEYYAPSEGVYQHYAWTKNGKVLLCNDSDGEYEQIFGNREELQRFVDHLVEYDPFKGRTLDQVAAALQETLDNLLFETSPKVVGVCTSITAVNSNE